MFRDARVSTHHEQGRPAGSRIESPLGTFTVGWWPQKIADVSLAPSLDMLVVENRRGEKRFLSRTDAIAESSAGGSMGGHDPQAHGKIRYVIRAFGKWADGKHSVCVSRIKTEHPEIAKGRNVNALCAWLKDQWAGTTKWRGKGSDPAQNAEDKAIQGRARATAYARFTHSMPVALDAPGLDALVEDVRSMTGMSPEQVLAEMGVDRAVDVDVFEAIWEAEVAQSSSAIASIEGDFRRYLAAPHLAVGSLEPLMEAWLALHGAPCDADEDPASLQECARFVLAGAGRPGSRLEQHVAAARESVSRELAAPRAILPVPAEEHVQETTTAEHDRGLMVESARAAGDVDDGEDLGIHESTDELLGRVDRLLEAHGLWTRPRHDALQAASRGQLARTIEMLEGGIVEHECGHRFSTGRNRCPSCGAAAVREDAPAPFRIGDLVAEAADDLSLGRRGKVVAESVDDRGAYIFDVMWEDGTGSTGVRQLDLRNLSWGVSEAARFPVAEYVERLRRADAGEWETPLSALQLEHGYTLEGAPAAGTEVRLVKEGEPSIRVRFSDSSEPLAVAVEHALAEGAVRVAEHTTRSGRLVEEYVRHADGRTERASDSLQEVAEDHPDFNWRTMGNRKRGVILMGGDRKTVGPEEFDRLKRTGQLSPKTPKLKGDGDPTMSRRGEDRDDDKSSGSGSGDFESKHPRADAGQSTGGQFIKAGSSGDDVETVQRKVGAEKDGKFGAETSEKVRAFQRKHGLVADGVVGHQTVVQMAGGDGKKAQAGALNASDRAKLARLRRGRARESHVPSISVELRRGPDGRRVVRVFEAGFDPRQPRDEQGRWREVVGKTMNLKVGDKPVTVRRGVRYDIERVADKGPRKYAVTRQALNRMVPAQRLYAGTAVDAADAAFGISPAAADSLARNIRAGRSQSERRRHQVLEGSADSILEEALAIVDEALSAQRVGWHGRAIRRPHAPRPAAGSTGYVRRVKGFSAGGVQRGTGYARAGGSQRVRRVQTYLSRLGYSVGARDGKFGRRTDGAVRAFQQKHGLKVDGVVGSQTLRRMRYRRKSAGTS